MNVEWGRTENRDMTMSKQNTSSFDRIKSHLMTRGSAQAVPASLDGDLETLVRRCDDVHSLENEYGSIELSPYMTSLLRVSKPASNRAVIIGAAAAASV